jgi:hypothetical protein
MYINISAALCYVLGSCKPHVSIIQHHQFFFFTSVHKHTLSFSQYDITSFHKCAIVTSIQMAGCVRPYEQKQPELCIDKFIIITILNNGQPVTQRDSQLHNRTACYTTGQPIAQRDTFIYLHCSQRF